jgi:hypothetical protein
MSKPSGLYVLHNTIIAENRNTETFSNAHFRNNLLLGTGAPGRPLAAFPIATAYSTFDYNGYRPNNASGNQYIWISPPKGQLLDYTVSVKEAKGFVSLKDFSNESGLEKHGIELDYDSFMSLRAPDPAKPHAVYHASDIDFRLNPNGKAVDKGLIMPNINNNHKGKAPDLGAIENGEPVPVYGPRNRLDQCFYR